MNPQRAPRFDLLAVLMLAYGAASLLHFAHNAIHIREYPNLPAWLSSALVWKVWFAETALGAAAYVLMRLGFAKSGVMLAALWAALGFDGLAHYARAPFAEHTWMMNLTIWLEVVVAAVLLVALALRLASRLRATPSASLRRSPAPLDGGLPVHRRLNGVRQGVQTERDVL